MNERRRIGTFVELAGASVNDGDGGEADGNNNIAHSVDGAEQAENLHPDDLQEDVGESTDAPGPSVESQSTPVNPNANSRMLEMTMREVYEDDMEDNNDDDDDDEDSAMLGNTNTNPHGMEDNVDNVERHSFTPMARGHPPLVDIGMPDDIPDMFWDDDVDDFVVIRDSTREIAITLDYVQGLMVDSSPVDQNAAQVSETQQASQTSSPGLRVPPVRQNLVNEMKQFVDTLSREMTEEHNATSHSDVNYVSGPWRGENGRVSSSALVERVEEHQKSDSPPSFEKHRADVKMDANDDSVKDESTSNNVALSDSQDKDDSLMSSPSQNADSRNNGGSGNVVNETAPCDEIEIVATESSESEAITSNESSTVGKAAVHSASTVDALKRALEEIIPERSDSSHKQEEGIGAKTPHPSFHSEIENERSSADKTIRDDREEDMENVAEAEFDFQSVSPSCPETVIASNERTEADADALLNRVINEETDACLKPNEYGFKMLGVANEPDCQNTASGEDKNRTGRSSPNSKGVDMSLHNSRSVQSPKVSKMDVMEDVAEISKEAFEFVVQRESFARQGKRHAMTKTQATDALDCEGTGWSKGSSRAADNEVNVKRYFDNAGIQGTYGAVLQNRYANVTQMNEEQETPSWNDRTMFLKEHCHNEGDKGSINNQSDEESCRLCIDGKSIIAISVEVKDKNTGVDIDPCASPDNKQHCGQIDDVNAKEETGESSVLRLHPEGPRGIIGSAEVECGPKQYHTGSNLEASRMILEATDVWIKNGEGIHPIVDHRISCGTDKSERISQVPVEDQARPLPFEPKNNSNQRSSPKPHTRHTSSQEYANNIPKAQMVESLETSAVHSQSNSIKFTRNVNAKYARALRSLRNTKPLAMAPPMRAEAELSSVGQENGNALVAKKPRREKVTAKTRSKRLSSGEIPESLINHGVLHPPNKALCDASSIDDNSISRCPARRSTPIDPQMENTLSSTMSKVSDVDDKNIFRKHGCLKGHTKGTHLSDETSCTTVTSMFSNPTHSCRENQYQDTTNRPDALKPFAPNPWATTDSKALTPKLQRSKFEPHKLYVPKKHLKPAGTSAEEYHRYKMDLRMSETLSKIRPAVDCYIDPRFVKRRSSSRESTQRLPGPKRGRENCLLTMENVKFMEVLQYKKTTTTTYCNTRNDQMKACKNLPIISPQSFVNPIKPNTEVRNLKNNAATRVAQRFQLRSRTLDKHPNAKPVYKASIAKGLRPEAVLKAKVGAGSKMVCESSITPRVVAEGLLDSPA